MPKRRFREAEFIVVIHQLDAVRTCVEVAREVGVSKHALYAWKAKWRTAGYSRWRQGEAGWMAYVP
jgi:transposase-like protein